MAAVSIKRSITHLNGLRVAPFGRLFSLASRFTHDGQSETGTTRSQHLKSQDKVHINLNKLKLFELLNRRRTEGQEK